MYDVTIVGCGVVGASLAYKLSQYKLRVLVLERGRGGPASGDHAARARTPEPSNPPAHHRKRSARGQAGRRRGALGGRAGGLDDQPGAVGNLK